MNDFTGSYKWGSHSSDNVFSPEADQQVEAGIGSVYGLMNQLAKEAKAFTSTAKGYQRQFESSATGK